MEIKNLIKIGGALLGLAGGLAAEAYIKESLPRHKKESKFGMAVESAGIYAISAAIGSVIATEINEGVDAVAAFIPDKGIIDVECKDVTDEIEE